MRLAVWFMFPAAALSCMMTECSCGHDDANTLKCIAIKIADLPTELHEMEGNERIIKYLSSGTSGSNHDLHKELIVLGEARGLIS